MDILELQKVSYTYESASKKVLNNINLNFKKGKIYGIIGKSGSGKTTLLSLMSGLESIKEGKIFFDGKELANIDRDAYRAKDIGIVFQGYNLITTATALDNVILSMDICGIKGNKKEKALELLEHVGIDQDKAQRKVLKLSGGEQQRVGIACALSNHSKIIFADEPTGNLDGENEKIIMELFVRLAREHNKCVIIVSHAKGIGDYVDELYEIKNGRVNFLNSYAK